MPRTARIKPEFGLFHIKQNCGCCRRIFESEEDKDKFIQILQKTQQKFQFKLYGWCLTDSEYNLIIEVNGNDLSKIMKSINISYALYTRCEGKLFKDRFKSTIIKHQDIEEVIKKIGNSWNLCDFNELKPLAIRTLQLNFDDYCEGECIRTAEEAKVKLSEVAHRNSMDIAELFNNIDIRNRLIKDIRRHSTLSLKAIGSVFNLSESSVSKILNN